MRRTRTGIGAAALLAVAAILSACAGAPPAEPVNLATIEATPSLADVATVAVLGDSMSLGVNACAEPGRCLSSSWATGDDPAVASVALRVGEVAGEFPEVVNAAKDGGTVADALARVDDVIAAQPDLVLLLLGGNDLCGASVDDMTSAENYRTAYSEILSRLSAEIDGVKIMAMSVPDLHRLWEVGHDNDAAAQLWNQAPNCKNLLSDAQATDAATEARRAAVAERNTEFNAAIAEVCTADVSCTTDGGRLFAYPFTPEQISSIDYFHPSVAGEAVIAEIAWTALEKANAQ